MIEDIKQILITEQEIDEITTRLGKEITEDYRGKKLVLIGLLKGSVLFMSDLMRKIDLPCSIDFMIASSYFGGTKRSNIVQIKKDTMKDLSGFNVLIVEDIIDSGNTLHTIKELLKDRHAESVKICTFLDKPSCRQVDVEVDYVGQQISDEFVVGYGLDYAEEYRNLPFLGILSPSVYDRK